MVTDDDTFTCMRCKREDIPVSDTMWLIAWPFCPECIEMYGRFQSSGECLSAIAESVPETKGAAIVYAFMDWDPDGDLEEKRRDHGYQIKENDG